MASLLIENIGPIAHVEFEINRYNVFIGQQSSGKSTIAKIISFSQWLEKECFQQQDTDFVDQQFFATGLREFYGMTDYFNDGFKISYRGKAIEYDYCGDSDSVSICEVRKTDRFSNFSNCKIAYIPSDRNFITLPNIQSIYFPMYSYIKSFVFDWLDSHGKFKKDNSVELIGLGAKYYCSDGVNNDDIIVLNNKKEIKLRDASSGIQSVTPLFVYLKYITDWIFQHPEDVSYNKTSEIENKVLGYLGRELGEINKDDNTPQEVLNNKFKPILNALKHHPGVIEKSFGKVDLLQRVLDFERRLSMPTHSHIIIEEPEQNLFPSTQIELIYTLLKMQHNTDDTMVITTHSPYLLYAINNCLLAYLVKDDVDDDDDKALEFVDSMALDPKKVSVWQLENGEFVTTTGNMNLTIQDERGLIRKNFFDSIMKEVMNDFSSLITYLD